MYVVTGATGNTGQRITEALLKAGKQVRVFGRSEARLKGLIELGAEAFIGDFEDEKVLTQAFEGAIAVYAMIPTNFQSNDYRGYQNKVGEAIAAALKNTGVRYVVNLSSLGAESDGKTGPIAGLRDQEQRLAELQGTNILHLRPAFFMENHYATIPLLKGQGIIGSPLKPDVAIPQIHTKDIADKAIEALLELNFSGHQVQELLGEREVTMREVTLALGTALGKDIPYVPFSYEDAEQGMIAGGLTKNVSQAMVELYQAINDGVIGKGTQQSATITKTSIESFAKEFAQAYRNS